ncbi:unnamed protein product [Symbiodinium sp. CCMP2456]|nr:unnamed protein product [Symbiodinium sp. CCMP2456]
MPKTETLEPARPKCRKNNGKPKCVSLGTGAAGSTRLKLLEGAKLPKWTSLGTSTTGLMRAEECGDVDKPREMEFGTKGAAPVLARLRTSTDEPVLASDRGKIEDPGQTIPEAGAALPQQAGIRKKTDDPRCCSLNTEMGRSSLARLRGGRKDPIEEAPEASKSKSGREMPDTEALSSAWADCRNDSKKPRPAKPQASKAEFVRLRERSDADDPITASSGRNRTKSDRAWLWKGSTGTAEPNFTSSRANAGNPGRAVDCKGKDGSNCTLSTTKGEDTDPVLTSPKANTDKPVQPELRKNIDKPGSPHLETGTAGPVHPELRGDTSDSRWDAPHTDNVASEQTVPGIGAALPAWHDPLSSSEEPVRRIRNEQCKTEDGRAKDGQQETTAQVMNQRARSQVRMLQSRVEQRNMKDPGAAKLNTRAAISACEELRSESDGPGVAVLATGSATRGFAKESKGPNDLRRGPTLELQGTSAAEPDLERLCRDRLGPGDEDPGDVARKAKTEAPGLAGLRGSDTLPGHTLSTTGERGNEAEPRLVLDRAGRRTSERPTPEVDTPRSSCAKLLGNADDSNSAERGTGAAGPKQAQVQRGRCVRGFEGTVQIPYAHSPGPQEGGLTWRDHKQRLRSDERNPDCTLSAADDENTGPTLEMPQGTDGVGPVQARLLEDVKLPGDKKSATNGDGPGRAMALAEAEDPSWRRPEADGGETDPTLVTGSTNEEGWPHASKGLAEQVLSMAAAAQSYCKPERMLLGQGGQVDSGRRAQQWQKAKLSPVHDQQKEDRPDTRDAKDQGRPKDLSDNTDPGPVAPETDTGSPSQAALRGNKKEPKWAQSTADKANTGPARARPDVKAVGPTRESACKGTKEPESEKRETDDAKPRQVGDRKDSGLPSTALPSTRSRTPGHAAPEASAALPEQADIRMNVENPVRANWHAGRKLPTHAELRAKSEKPGLLVAAADSRNTKPARASPVADTPKEGLPVEKLRKPQQRHLPKQGFAEARNCQGDWASLPAELLPLGRMNVVTGMVPKSCSQSQKERIRSHSIPDQTEESWAQDENGYEEVEQDQAARSQELMTLSRLCWMTVTTRRRQVVRCSPPAERLRSDKKTPECALPDTDSKTSIRARPHADTELLMCARVLGDKAKPAELQKSASTKKPVLLKLLMDSVGPGLAFPGANSEDTKPARTSPTIDDSRTDTAEPVQAELLSSEAVPGHVASAAGSRKTEPVRAKPTKGTLKPERLGCCGGGEKPQVARFGTGKAGPARLKDRKGSGEPAPELPGTGKDAPNQDMPDAGNAKSIRTWLRTKSEEWWHGATPHKASDQEQSGLIPSARSVSKPRTRHGSGFEAALRDPDVRSPKQKLPSRAFRNFALEDLVRSANTQEPTRPSLVVQGFVVAAMALVRPELRRSDGNPDLAAQKAIGKASVEKPRRERCLANRDEPIARVLSGQASELALHFQVYPDFAVEGMCQGVDTAEPGLERLRKNVLKPGDRRSIKEPGNPQPGAEAKEPKRAAPETGTGRRYKAQTGNGAEGKRRSRQWEVKLEIIKRGLGGPSYTSQVYAFHIMSWSGEAQASHGSEGLQQKLPDPVVKVFEATWESLGCQRSRTNMKKTESTRAMPAAGAERPRCATARIDTDESTDVNLETKTLEPSLPEDRGDKRALKDDQSDVDEDEPEAAFPITDMKKPSCKKLRDDSDGSRPGTDTKNSGHAELRGGNSGPGSAMATTGSEETKPARVRQQLPCARGNVEAAADPT